MNPGVQLRVPRNLWHQLWEGVRRPDVHEPVVFGLVSEGKTADRTLVLVQDLIHPPPTAFERTANQGAKWSGACNIALLNKALARRLGIVIFHHHPGTGQVRLSSDDELSARQLLPAYHMVVPGRPHGSVVLGESSVTGLIILPGTSPLIRDFQTALLQ